MYNTGCPQITQFLGKIEIVNRLHESGWDNTLLPLIITSTLFLTRKSGEVFIIMSLAFEKSNYKDYIHHQKVFFRQLIGEFHNFHSLEFPKFRGFQGRSSKSSWKAPHKYFEISWQNKLFTVSFLLNAINPHSYEDWFEKQTHESSKSWILALENCNSRTTPSTDLSGSF